MNHAMNAAELQQKCLALEAALRDKEGELATLRELAQDLSQDVQAAKIIDLSKKNRTLNLALEREKQRSAKLQADLAAGGGGRPTSSSGPTAAPDVEAIEEVARSMVEKAAEAAEAAQKEAAMWKDKLSQTTNRIAQLEQKVFTMEAENKKLTRALVREVGEDVPLAKVLDESGNSEWKGRREQIIALRDQVKQLKAAVGQAPAETKQEAAAKGVINKISKERNQEMDRLNSDLTAVRGELDALKLKYDGAVSRRKILEAELSSMKAKVAVVLEKTQMDDKLIAALKAEVASLRRGAQGVAGGVERPSPARAASRSTTANPQDDEELWRELGSLRRRVAEQEEQIDRQEAIILALQQRASAASTPTAGAGRPGSGSRPGSGGQTTSSGRWDSSAEQQIKLLEVENSRLSELVMLLQRKLETM